jgi:signal transducing adaptor molecule
LPPQQDPQRFYSPAPADAPGISPGFPSPYPQQNGPPPTQNGPAPFHFIPGGIAAPSGNEIRRKPSPHGAPSLGPNDPYNTTQAFQGQIRPNSIHTLNSGNPQELATSGYESPVDSRHSYPPVQGQQPPAQDPGYNAYAAPSQHAPPVQPQHAPSQQSHYAPPQPQPGSDNVMPIRQRTQSFESPTSTYSTQPEGQYATAQAAPQHPSGPPPAAPGMPSGGSAPYQAYQPYQQQPQPVQTPQGPPSSGNDGDPGDFYR